MRCAEAGWPFPCVHAVGADGNTHAVQDTERSAIRRVEQTEHRQAGGEAVVLGVIPVTAGHFNSDIILLGGMSHFEIYLALLNLRNLLYLILCPPYFVIFIQIAVTQRDKLEVVILNGPYNKDCFLHIRTHIPLQLSHILHHRRRS